MRVRKPQPLGPQFSQLVGGLLVARKLGQKGQVVDGVVAYKESSRFRPSFTPTPVV